MRTESVVGILLSIVVIYSLLTSVVLPILGWTFPTSASSEAQIWTEDAEGNIRMDFEPDETVYIRGSGFNLNAQIEVTITRPDNTVDQGSTLSDGNGNFVYAYLLNGIHGTYYVTATDGVNSASTPFDDSPKIQGFDKETREWSSGSLSGWEELDWVPYRIMFKDLPEGYSSYIFKVYHNNLLDNEDGVDRLRDFRVGDEDGNPVTGSVNVSGPYYNTPGKGCDRDIYYAISVIFRAASPRLTWYVYWQAHLAFGASKWPGSSLHAYTDISGTRGGKQDVGINVPPNPTGSISGSEWNDLNRNGVWDLDELGLSDWTIQLYSFDSVESTWIHLVDENTDAAGVHTFSGLVNGNYYLAEILQDNWIQTYPSAGIHSVTLSEGENRSALDFGNFSAVRRVVVSISPSYQSAPPSTTLNYTVTVTNTGDVVDNYALSVSDNAGWGTSVSPESLILLPGASDNATLSVTVPENAVPSAEDNIVVRATSQADNRVSAENSVIAHVSIVRGVGVSISPTYQENGPGATLDYVVVVTNEGNVVDNYVLTTSDNENWGATLSDNKLEVQPGDNGIATLSLTIPENALGNKEATIIVTGTSTENTEVSDNDNSIAKVSVVRGVDVSISPSLQSGTHGMILTYNVTITNTGNIEDTYDITASDNAGWGLEFNLVQVKPAPYGSAVVWYLKVTVPEDAPVGAEDNITVTATSTDNVVSDSDSCIAHRPKAEFSLATLYKVILDIDFYFETGSKLIVKFYTYGDAYENENVWSGTAPAHVEGRKNVRHPENIGVKKARLDLTTDDTGNVIETIASFIVRKVDLEDRFMWIPFYWSLAGPAGKLELETEFMWVPFYLSGAPS